MDRQHIQRHINNLRAAYSEPVDHMVDTRRLTPHEIEEIIGMAELRRHEPQSWDWMDAPDPLRGVKRIAGCAVFAVAVWLIWTALS